MLEYINFFTVNRFYERVLWHFKTSLDNLTYKLSVQNWCYGLDRYTVRAVTYRYNSKRRIIIC